MEAQIVVQQQLKPAKIEVILQKNTNSLVYEESKIVEPEEIKNEQIEA